jgi:hemolysin activation/secretion protein
LLPHDWSVSCAARAQISDQNLLSSEQIGVGGYDSVRGYSERQLGVDNAIVLNAELRTPKWGIVKYFTRNTAVQDTLQFLGFLDYGAAWDHIPLPPEPTFQYLVSTGLGVRYFFGQYLSVRADYGFKLHKADYPGGIGELHFGFIGSY